MTGSPNWGWSGSVSAFLSTEESGFIEALTAHHHRCMGMPPDAGQVTAWRNEYRVLRACFALLVSPPPSPSHSHGLDPVAWHLIFEYELPRERGRRPDVVVLTGAQVAVLEFKDAELALAAYVDQAAAYARDLAEYHAASHDRLIDPVLVLTRSDLREPARRQSRGVLNGSEVELVTGLPSKRSSDPRPEASRPSPYQVTITGPSSLSEVLLSLAVRAPAEPIDADKWLAADYDPLPSLVNAARLIFTHEELPHIRRAHSAGIPETVDQLIRAGEEARDRGEHHLALVTGVPGSGKTLVGLQFVYQNHFNDRGSGRTSVFLSGNGPLVDVLQYALKSGIFVQDVHGFLKQYGGDGGRVPEEHIWVYDEAQRAWDASRVREKRGHGYSEPEDFLRIGSRKPWALMVGLIGEGQEIHLGEEAGLRQWNDAIARMDEPWVVHCPNKLAGLFPAATRVERSDYLDLTASLRTHVAEDVQRWVELLLAGHLDSAESLMEDLERQGFDIYRTSDLEMAKAYVRERYEGQRDKRYGLLASSKAKLEDHGIDSGWHATRRLRVGPWFYDQPDQPRSCCQLEEVATEFQCQGLELDFPIVCWGRDLWWDGKRWVSPPTRRSKAKDPHQLRLNSYRVLLTRGRDGVLLWAPREAAATNPVFLDLPLL